MRFGLFSINTGACADPDVAVEVAIAAEEAGFDSVWTGEHVVLPDPRVPPSPVAPLVPFLDPLIALATIAAQTFNIRLATGIVILPQRNPLVLAKEIATLDVVSQGRVVLGVGAGYLQPEFAALHAPFDDRGTRVEDALAAMRAIWTMDAPSHEGPYWSFAGVQARPRPLQQPVPIVMGGHGAAALSRAVRLCDGWYGFGLDVERTRACTDGLTRAAAEHDRPAGMARLEVTVTPPPRPLTAEDVEAYAALGVDRLVVLPRGSDDRDALLRLVEDTEALMD